MYFVLSLALLGTAVNVSYAQISESSGWSVIDVNDGQWGEVLERDVCVVGGGSSGVHAAVSLVDLDKTVAVIERRDRLGGHTQTWIDPKTQVPVDFGVVIHPPIPPAIDYFAKFDIPLLNLSSVTGNEPGAPANKSLPALCYNTIQRGADFRDGSAVVGNTVTDPEAFERLAAILSDYAYLLEGYDLPDPVPEELYIPFGAFLEKHNLTSVVPTYYQYAQGMGDLLHISTIYVIKYFNLGDLQAVTQGYLTDARGNTSELYSKAGDYIGNSNLFLESTVVSTNRQNTTLTPDRLELLISTRGQGLKLLSCGQVLLTIPPTLSNLGGWDLTSEEHAVFSQYTNTNGYWNGLVTNIGLNQTITYLNAAATTPSNIPVLPALYALTAVGVVDDVWAVKFGSNTAALENSLVQDYITTQIQTLQRANNAPITEPVFLEFDSHTPFHLQVSPEAIRDGFFKKLTALQGGLGGKMFYSGAAFHTQYSALLWRFNQEVVIPMMMNST